MVGVASPRSSGGRRSLSAGAKVYEGLREQILTGDLEPGSWLVEAQLAEQFGVSRTPVREALRRLVDDHLVTHDLYRGAVVRGVDLQEAIEIGQLHEVHDGLAARLAAQRADAAGIKRLGELVDELRAKLEGDDLAGAVAANTAFHNAIYDIAGNSRLTGVARELAQSMRRFSASALADPSRAQQVIAEHERCVATIASRDADAAEQAARAHGRACMSWTGNWISASSSSAAGIVAS